MPKTLLLSEENINFDTLDKFIQFPVILKKINGVKGEGIVKCTSKFELEDILEIIRSNPMQDRFILQEFIRNPKIKKYFDIRVFTIGKQIMGAIKRTSSRDHFKTNVAKGAQVEIFELDAKLKKNVEKIIDILGLEIAGIDFLFDGKEFYFTEANPMPNFFGFEKATQINIAKSILEYLALLPCFV